MKRLHLLITALLLSLLISGCVTQPIDEEGTTEDIGQERKKSPADIYVQLGIAYMQEGQYQTALKKLRRGLAVDDKNADVHNVMALLYSQLNQTEKASDYFDKAISLRPKDPYIRNARGTHYCKLGRYADADADFNVALDNPLYDTPWVALTNAGLCSLRQQNVNGAETYFRRALTRNSQYPFALEQMAEIMFQQENYLSARAYLERYVTIQQPNAATLWLGIRIENALGNSDAMKGYKKQLLDNYPDAPEVALMRDMG